MLSDEERKLLLAAVFYIEGQENSVPGGTAQALRRIYHRLTTPAEPTAQRGSWGMNKCPRCEIGPARDDGRCLYAPEHPAYDLCPMRKPAEPPLPVQDAEVVVYVCDTEDPTLPSRSIEDTEFEALVKRHREKNLALSQKGIHRNQDETDCAFLIRYICKLRASSSPATREQIEAIGNAATLEPDMQWGRDAMQQFDFGKKQASKAIADALLASGLLAGGQPPTPAAKPNQKQET